MRELSDFELELVSGGLAGDDEEVVVNGYRPSYPSFTNPGSGYYPSNPSPSYGGGSAPAPAGYTSPNVSAAANAFANAHVHNANPPTAADTQLFQRDHDSIAKIYDYAQSHPNEYIDIGGGKWARMSSIINDISHADVQFTHESLGFRPNGSSIGANTSENPNGTYTIKINTDSADTKQYMAMANNAGVDYMLFHEIGHAIEGQENRANYAYQNQPGTNAEETHRIEGSANTTQSNLEALIGEGGYTGTQQLRSDPYTNPAYSPAPPDYRLPGRNGNGGFYNIP